MNTFLSIDLDYWNDVENGTGRMAKYLKQVYNSGIRVVLVRDHDEMLPFVDASKARHLINLDYHSDLCDIYIEKDEVPVLGKTQDFNCGTWVNWVQCRSKGRFLWIHPHQQCYINSRCNGDRKGIGRCDLTLNPFTKEFDTGWKSVKHCTGPPPKINLIDNLVMIGICVSPDYITFDQEIPYQALSNAGFVGSERCVDGQLLYSSDRQSVKRVHCGL